MLNTVLKKQNSYALVFSRFHRLNLSVRRNLHKCISTIFFVKYI